MHVEEVDQYKVKCHVFYRDLKEHGITVDDIMNRTPLAHMFFKKAGEIAKSCTGYQWPGCGQSMAIEIYKGGIVLTFSERIEDYVYSLWQTAQTMPKEQAEPLEKVIRFIKASEEEKARQIIANFEKNIREVQNG